MKDFILPNIGEGIETVSISEILVKENQSLSKDDTIMLVETDKASMEIPIDCTCTIEKVLVKTGDLISPGQPILKISNIDSEIQDNKEDIENIVNVPTEEKHQNKKINKSNDISKPINKIQVKSTDKIHASPSIRKLARELGCDLDNIVGSGLNNRITKSDLYNHIKGNNSQKPIIQNTNDNLMEKLSKWGLVEKKDLNSVAITSAEHLHNSWNTIPHVTQFDKADVTELYKLIKTLKSLNKNEDTKVSYIPFFMKISSYILKEINIFNSSLNSDNKSLIQKHYINIGFAVDSPKGLLVPVIKNINKKSIKKITIEFNSLVLKARKGQLTLDDMSGGCFTISSLGNIGGKYFTPIINSPEVAILGISPIQTEPILKNNKFIARKMLPISLSYDHRVINGADAAKFTKLFSELIQRPAEL
tara:strand:- start:3040 stop:4296 length:1257 start_codon:yes stop_codon:yes gene_type:complete